MISRPSPFLCGCIAVAAAVTGNRAWGDGEVLVAALGAAATVAAFVVGLRAERTRLSESADLAKYRRQDRAYRAWAARFIARLERDRASAVSLPH